MCLILFLQNKELKDTLSATTLVAQVKPLQPGERVERFTVTTFEGSTREITYTDPTRKYLFFVLSTTCPHCANTLPTWKSIAQTYQDSFDVIGISLHNIDETRKYFEAKDVGFYLASVANDTSFSRKYKISGVPETMLIDGNGIVEKVWIGKLTREQTSEIHNLMSPD